MKRDVLEYPMSTVAAQVVQAAASEDVTSSELGDLASSDPGFALRLLALANSPAFGASVPIGDVRRAATHLGVRGVRNLALSLWVTDLVPEQEGAEVLLSNALRRAVTTRALAQRVGAKDPEACHTAGLLLDAGIMLWAREAFEDAVDVARAPAPHRTLKERAFGHCAHPDSGSAMARCLRLPDPVAEAIHGHHDPEPPAGQVARLAWVAERVCAVFEGFASAEDHRAARKALEVLDISDPERDAVFRELPGLTAEAGRALKRTLGEQPDPEALLRDATRSLVALNRHYASAIQQLEAVVAEKEQVEQELREANRQLAEQARIDALTGLPNRRALDHELTRELARSLRDETGLALLMLDLDHFKAVNDTHGHRAGDDVLRAFAQVLRASVRASDLPCRYGGEEFVVVLPTADADAARQVASRIRTSLQGSRIQTSAGALRVTVSVGVAAVEAGGLDGGAAPSELLDAADKALYRAKHEGRNRVVVASSPKASDAA